MINNKAPSIMPSKREGIYYKEHCKVLMKDDRVEYVMAKNEDEISYYWNIPTANTLVLLLGSGTSITQAAARRLAEDGVMLAFVGGSGSPIFLASQSEYRPTEYAQSWISKWLKPDDRLAMCKSLSYDRCDFVTATWKNLDVLNRQSLKPSSDAAAAKFREKIDTAVSGSQIMEAEALCAKSFYAELSKTFKATGFTRQHGKQDDADLINSYLDHGNYIAYGLSATVLWVLGIPHSFPVSHGLTRRGALVFDLADVIKDGVVMPLAFAFAKDGKSDSEFRGACMSEIRRLKCVELMFDSIKKCCNL